VSVHVVASGSTTVYWQYTAVQRAYTRVSCSATASDAPVSPEAYATCMLLCTLHDAINARRVLVEVP
jgi:hypothetical protein